MQTDVRKFENLQYLIRYPENFTPGQRYPVILNIHGAGSRGTDISVIAERSISMGRAVNKKGGSAKITVYPERKHDAWTDTYSNPQVFAWLLSHTRKAEEVTCNDYGDSKKYG